MKYFVLVFSILALSVACKRRPGQVPTHGSIEWKESVVTASSASTPIVSETSEVTTNEAVVVSPSKKKVSKKPFTALTKKTTVVASDKRSEEPGKVVATKKEIPTALSNAMWMTFIGLGGVVLMLLLLSWFDTTVLLALFGLVFIIGVVSWIMYKIRTKPKVKS